MAKPAGGTRKRASSQVHTSSAPKEKASKKAAVAVPKKLPGEKTREELDADVSQYVKQFFAKTAPKKVERQIPRGELR